MGWKVVRTMHSVPQYIGTMYSLPIYVQITYNYLKDELNRDPSAVLIPFIILLGKNSSVLMKMIHFGAARLFMHTIIPKYHTSF
jgi:hypothetical protein